MLTSGSQFRPPPPHNVRGKAYAADLNEVKALGGDEATGSTRTPDQTEIGLFWRESSPQQWNRIARAISEERGLDAWENARLFALLNVSLTDGYIGSWETKYHYLFWRPVTAIHLADTDGNPLTHADPNWVPLQFTYPMPDYDSGHAVQGGAAAEALKRFFRTDVVSFTVCSFTLAEGNNCGDPGVVYRSVHALLTGRQRELALADLHRHSFPARRRGRRTSRAPHRRACRQSLLPSCGSRRSIALSVAQETTMNLSARARTRNPRLAAAIVGALTLWCAGCGNEPTAPSRTAPPPGAPAPPPPPMATISGTVWLHAADGVQPIRELDRLRLDRLRRRRAEQPKPG